MADSLTATIAAVHLSSRVLEAERPAPSQAVIMFGMLVLSASRVFWPSLRSEKLPIFRSRKKAFHLSCALGRAQKAAEDTHEVAGS